MTYRGTIVLLRYNIPKQTYLSLSDPQNKVPIFFKVHAFFFSLPLIFLFLQF